MLKWTLGVVTPGRRLALHMLDPLLSLSVNKCHKERSRFVFKYKGKLIFYYWVYKKYLLIII